MVAASGPFGASRSPSAAGPEAVLLGTVSCDALETDSSWRQTTSRLQSQAAAASGELAGRADARASAPFRDMDSTTLQTELARAEQRLWAATTVAEHHETISRTWQNRADELTRQREDILDGFLGQDRTAGGDAAQHRDKRRFR